MTLNDFALPTMEAIGDNFRDSDGLRRGLEANVLFIVHVECEMSGHALYFRPPDPPTTDSLVAA